MKVNQIVADEIAARTQDAYSFDAYGEKRWLACCRMLAKSGYSKTQIEDIMRSKFTRWAGDGAEKTRYGRHNSSDLKRFLDNSKITPETLATHLH